MTAARLRPLAALLASFACGLVATADEPHYDVFVTSSAGSLVIGGYDDAATTAIVPADQLRVFGGEVVVHFDADGTVLGATDDRLADVAVDTTPALDADTAIELAHQFQLPQVEGLLSRYAAHLMEEGKTMAAVELYRKANRDTESARLLAQLGHEAVRTKLHPLRAKQFFVLAALEVERHRKRTLDVAAAAAAASAAAGGKGATGAGGGASAAAASQPRPPE
jgi:hypothetical protein